MGEYFRHDDFQTQFADALVELASSYSQLSARWGEAYRNGVISRDDLLLNHGTASLGIRALRKLLSEAAAKLDKAINGVYRYRDSERSLSAAKRRASVKRKRTKRNGLSKATKAPDLRLLTSTTPDP